MTDLKNIGVKYENYVKNIEGATIDSLIKEFKDMRIPYMVYINSLENEKAEDSWKVIAAFMTLMGISNDGLEARVSSVAYDELFKVMDAKLREEIANEKNKN